MPGLVPGIHVLLFLLSWGTKDVDGRDKPGHDDASFYVGEGGTYAWLATALPIAACAAARRAIGTR